MSCLDDIRRFFADHEIPAALLPQYIDIVRSKRPEPHLEALEYVGRVIHRASTRLLPTLFSLVAVNDLTAELREVLPGDGHWREQRDFLEPGRFLGA